MRRPLIAAVLTITALTIVVFTSEFVRAQGQPLPTPPRGFQAPPDAPIKPYKPVAVTPPAPLGDPTFVALRKQLADIATSKDRAALATLVVAQGFFWLQDKDVADKKKSGIDNLAKAIGLDDKDGPGWSILSGFAAEPTAGALPQHNGVMCGPGDPTFDPKAFQALIAQTQTDFSEWAYPTKDGIEVHGAAQPAAPVIEKLGLYFVRVLPDTAPPANPNDPFFLHVATPSAKSGFVDAQLFAPLGGDRLCYIKDASGWKITGYLGGGAQ